MHSGSNRSVAGRGGLAVSVRRPRRGRLQPRGQPEDPDAPGRLLLHLRDLHHNHGYKEMESLVDPSRVGI